ncbi:poly-beta-1,6-N-acetyl-D-glucosamine N-deacetylase PgaB [Methylotenera versatilis]|uniref:Polysaccharide deacetylase n=1 Tax=Methylotenera versatilis (strain 301) TaxID=666681 RepID=D7DK51_METV0|nr:poly-beta-1,6-N-acetyl-D-glucosamine N-deacetylase PgaB [Methylotenera versatilis]ADI28436.1 polysaccharide deacetylase [Methylotenera versatilis 301]
MIRIFFYVLLLLANTSALATTNFAGTQTFEVFSYHDVRDSVDGDLEQESTTISTKNLARHFAWIQAHGYHPISINDLLDAKAGKKSLPSKPVLLTFDDGYESLYSRAYPLLKLYQYPAVAALVGSWLEVKTGGTVKYGDDLVPREHFLSTAQIKEMADSGLVEFASHSFDLHHGILANPQGNMIAAAVTLQYDSTTKTYESRENYRTRIKQDFIKNNAVIQRITGKQPRVMVWPYGANNAIASKVANETGMPITLNLSEAEQAQANNLTQVARFLIDGNPSEMRLAEIERHEPNLDKQRAMHIDLDYVYDDHPEQLSKNLDLLLDRVKSLAPTTVYLQAFSDTNGDGVAEAVYFPNRHVDMRADLFGRVAWQLMTRANVKVYAWMPVLAFELKDKQKQQMLQVVSAQPSADKASYKRLTPFSPEAKQIIKEIYSDLGAYTKFSGVLFHDDAVFSESEDDSEYARAYYQKGFKLVGANITEINQNPTQAAKLAALKSQYLIEFTSDLAKELKRYQPELKTARNLYAPALLNPASERWLSQNYRDFIANYDYTAVMAMPLMENVANPDTWLKSLVAQAKLTKNGLQKTVFELQATDWKSKRPIKSEILKQEMQTLSQAGAIHMGYYPDDFLHNQPEMEVIRPYISSRNFPYLPKSK